MSGAVAFVFGLCALSFAAGCVLTACMLRREPEPEPVAVPAPVRAEPRLDLRRPPEDYATRPIHRNPVMGLPVSAPPAEPARPALTLVPALVPVIEDVPEEPAPVVPERLVRVVEDAEPEPGDVPEPEDAEPAVHVVAEPEVVVPQPVAADAGAVEPAAGAAEGPGVWSEPVAPELPAQATSTESAPPERSAWFTAERPVLPGQPDGKPGLRPVPGPLPAQPSRPTDPGEFRRRYLRTFEAARRRTR